jgi:glutamyl-tRNA reductase
LNSKNITDFFIVGINYRKTEAAVRGSFAINPQQYENILLNAPALHLDELFILSTCNRTEVYGFAASADQLIELVCTQTVGDAASFTKMAYVKKGKAAIEHLFQVAAGLDSQLLGDYEIVGQLKQAVKLAKQHNFIGSFTDRLVNAALQASKNIKNNTELSGGTVSVSFAAVQYIREHFTDCSNKKILLIGTGKIGRNTCKNLVDYLGTTNITLVNRTEQKATELAMELGLHSLPIEHLPEAIQAAEIILVATNAETPTILKTHLQDAGDKLIIDLSIPYNVETSAQHLPNIHLVNVDDLSKLKDATLKKRKAEVPKAKAIIAEHIAEFKAWQDMRKNVPVLKAVKNKLQQMSSCQLFISSTTQNNIAGHTAVNTTEESIQKVINTMALKMRSHNQRGCQYIEAINDFIAVGEN